VMLVIPQHIRDRVHQPGRRFQQARVVV